MTPELQKKLGDLFLNRKIIIVSIGRDDGFIVILLDDGHLITIREAELTPPMTQDHAKDSVRSAGHLTDPFDTTDLAKEAEKSSTPACLGGNTADPAAPDMFPGPGV